MAGGGRRKKRMKENNRPWIAVTLMLTRGSLHLTVLITLSLPLNMLQIAPCILSILVVIDYNGMVDI